MHRKLIELLPNAIGESKHIIALIVDIRGFSKFSNTTDSINVATYISNIYIKLIDLFSKIDENIFYKPTGDGLLITISYSSKNLKERFNKTVGFCIDCHDNFEKILEDVEIINFPIPDKIGFGITRGFACALTSVDEKNDEKFVLDYSGHKLNLAARLQDLARPSGIVIEGTKDINLLDKELKNKLSEEQVFIKSLAEEKSISIWKTDSVIISPLNLKSLIGRWETEEYKLTKSQFNKSPARFHLFLEPGVIVESTAQVNFYRPTIVKKEAGGKYTWHELENGKDYWFHYEAGKPKICLNFESIKNNYKLFIDAASTRHYLKFKINYQVI